MKHNLYDNELDDNDDMYRIIEEWHKDDKNRSPKLLTEAAKLYNIIELFEWTEPNEWSHNPALPGKTLKFQNLRYKFFLL